MRDLESSFGDTSGVESLVTGAIPSHYFSAGAGNLIVLQTRAIVSGWTGVGQELPLAQPAGGLGSTVPRAYPEASGRDRGVLSCTALQDIRHGWGALCVLCPVLPSTQGTAVLIPVMDMETGV